MDLEKVTFSTVRARSPLSSSDVFYHMKLEEYKKWWCIYLLYITKTNVCFSAIQFVLSDEFSHLRPEQRLALLHVSSGSYTNSNGYYIILSLLLTL